jgi:hypothetical protein
LARAYKFKKTDFGGKLTIDYFASDDLRKVLDIIHKAESAVYGGTETKLLARIEAAVPLVQVPAQSVDAVIPPASVIEEIIPTPEEEHFTRHDTLDVPEVSLTQEETQEEYSEHDTVEDVLQKVAQVQSEQPAIEPVVAQSVEPEKSDDADLYSIKNFSL